MLKHVKAGALVAALLPLAFVTPAGAWTLCVDPSAGVGGLCGFVWNDANNNGKQDDGAGSGIPLAKVFISDGTHTIETQTGPDGRFQVFLNSGPTYTISVLIPSGSQPSRPNEHAANEVRDSDGELRGAYSVATVTQWGFPEDFGFFHPAHQHATE